MAQSLGKILLHTIFSTKQRQPFLRDNAFRDRLHHYLGGVLNHQGCQSIIVGGVADHVHVLAALSRTTSAAEMVRALKRSSSLWVKEQAPVLRDFAWQNGYGVFSIGFSQLERVRCYIASQEEHHRKVSFQDEFRSFLKRYQIAFEERYVWD